MTSWNCFWQTNSSEEAAYHISRDDVMEVITLWKRWNTALESVRLRLSELVRPESAAWDLSGLFEVRRDNRQVDSKLEWIVTNLLQITKVIKSEYHDKHGNR